MRRRLEPGPNHPISVEPVETPARVQAGGSSVIDAPRFLELREASYPAVAYLPRDCADMAKLVRSDHTTWCPYKGEASYFHIRKADGSLIENALWTYEDPLPAVAAIKDHLAAYSQRVDAVEIG